MKISIEICYNNKIYIWQSGNGIMNRELNKVSKETENAIIKYIKDYGLIIDNEREMIQFDFNR